MEKAGTPNASADGPEAAKQEGTSNKQEPPDDEGMTFWEHLEELRSRMFKMALAATAGGALAWWKHVEILEWLLEPFRKGWSQHFQEPPAIHFPNPAGLFVAYLKLAMIG